MHREEAPIIIVLENPTFTGVKSSSKHSTTSNNSACTIGFVVKNGVELLESIHSICRHEMGVITSEENRTIKMRIQKDGDFRFLEIKASTRCIRLEIEKPKTNEN